MMPIRRAIPLLVVPMHLLAASARAQEDAGRLVRTASGYELRVREQNGVEYSITLPASSVRRPEEPLPGRASMAAEAPVTLSAADPAAADPAVQLALERLALRSDDPAVRQAAVITLARTAAPGTGARLERIHRRSDDANVRRAALRLLSLAPDRRRALAYLTTIATGDANPADGYDAPAVAVWTLADMGDAGSAVLRDLHRRGAVHSPEGRVALDYVARNGFRAPLQP
ncbi:MAG TPA: HEAT repeat domain-containing protein [Longimicrobium sp.]